MYNEKMIQDIFKVLNVDPDEEFSVVAQNLNDYVLIKNAYISERLYLVDKDSGTAKNEYLLNIMRGIYSIKKHEKTA